MRHVELIVGPPGSGKSTYAAKTGLAHLEREHYANDNLFTKAAAKHAGQPGARVAVVRTCATVGEQTKWETLIRPDVVVVLDVPFDECARRIHKRGRANWRGEVKAAQAWHDARRAEPAAPRSSRTW